VESPHPAFLVTKDTGHIGTIKGIERIYQQTGINIHALTFCPLFHISSFEGENLMVIILAATRASTKAITIINL